jgi:hypothetical protein
VSEQNPGAGRDPRRPPPDWPDQIEWPEQADRPDPRPPGSSVFEQEPTQPTAAPGHHHQEHPQYQPPPSTAPQSYPAPPPQFQPPPNQAHVPYVEPTRPVPQYPDQTQPGYGWPDDPGPTPRQHPGGQGYAQPRRAPDTPPGGQPPHLPRKQRRQERRDSARDYGGGGSDRSPSRRSGSGGGGGGGGGFSLPFGFGFLVGILGLGALLASLMVLPWFEAAGREVTLADIREAFEVPATDPDTLPGANADTPDTTAAEGALPTPDQAEDAVEGIVRDTATEAAASAIDTGKNRYLELYADTLWWVIAVAAGLSVLFSTVLSPKSFALSMILGFRRLSGFVTILGAGAHAVALWVIFSGNGPEPGTGVWIGVAGFAGVFLASILGPKR